MRCDLQTFFKSHSHLQIFRLVDDLCFGRDLVLRFADIKLRFGTTHLLERLPLIQGHLHGNLDHHLIILVRRSESLTEIAKRIAIDTSIFGTHCNFTFFFNIHFEEHVYGKLTDLDSPPKAFGAPRI